MPPPSAFISIVAPSPFVRVVTIAEFDAGTYGNVPNEVWFRYIPTNPNLFSFFVDTGGTFAVNVVTYESDGSTPVTNLVVGNTYYVHVTRSGGGPALHDLTCTAYFSSSPPPPGGNETPSFPANSNWETAVNIPSLPYNITQTDINNGGTNWPVWYKYTAIAGQNYIGIWGFSGQTTFGTYQPIIHVYTVPASTPIEWPNATHPIFGQNVPVQVPVVPGTTYYFEFEPNNNAVPAQVTISALTGPVPTTFVPVGSIFVNDDAFGFGAAFLSSANSDDHHVLRYLYPFIAGEYGDVLASNSRYLIEEKEVNLKLYNPQLSAVLANIPFVGPAGSVVIIRANQTTNKFYAGTRNFSGTTNITSIDANGVQGSVIPLPSPGLSALVSSNDDATLFLSGNPALTNSNIRTLVLGTGLFGADLVAAVTGYQVRDMLMLSDATLLVLYFKTTSVRDLQVRRYNSTTGALLGTYNFTLGNNLSPISLIGFGYRLAYAIDSPNSFWIWMHLDSGGGFQLRGKERFENVKVSDGSILSSIDYAEFEEGQYKGEQTPTPPARFGNSSSCPFIIVREAIGTNGGGTPPNEASGIYKIVPGKRNDTLWVSFDPIETRDVKIPNPFAKTALLGE